MDQLVFRRRPKHEQTDVHITRAQKQGRIEMTDEFECCDMHELNHGEMSSRMMISD